MSNFFLCPSSYFAHLQPPSPPPFSWQSPFSRRVRQTDRRVTALCFFIYNVFSVCLPALSPSRLRLILRILTSLILPPASFFLFLALLDLSHSLVLYPMSNRGPWVGCKSYATVH